ncbi:hypothetical protein [Sphingomonas sp. G-3-2-10]|uniref:hypothetical protein n=1 Tax=Sphingomonas sp. G-3-2-10 TaxID=2728838 RepID=UPI00146C2E56|nr:hypothetical protein [Sphingomonas sp. G-3-2-10]NML05403.1 hypothetical protein [Sphingomonas sp. G-3-2-10]
MTDDRESARNFEISSVVSRSFELISGNLPLYAGLALVLSGIPGFALRWWQFENPVNWFDQVMLWETLTNPIVWLPVLIIFVVSLVTSAILQASLTRAAVVQLSDGEPDFGQCLATGLSLIPQLVAIFLIAGITLTALLLVTVLPYGLAMGYLAGQQMMPAAIDARPWLLLLPIPILMLPFLFMMISWSVAVPAFVQERIGVIDGFRRSWALTRGVRFRIFLVMLAMWVAIWLLGIPVGLIAGVTAGIGTSPMIAALIDGAYSALTSMLNVVMVASIYVELRNAKENVAPETLETIFG